MSRYYCSGCETPHEEGQGHCPLEQEEQERPAVLQLLALCAQWLPKDLALRQAAFRVAFEQSDARQELEGCAMTKPDQEDICGFCGQPRADKIPHPVRWPGEESAGTEFVHALCEDEECRRAHALLTDKQRESFLRWV